MFQTVGLESPLVFYTMTLYDSQYPDEKPTEVLKHKHSSPTSLALNGVYSTAFKVADQEQPDGSVHREFALDSTLWALVPTDRTPAGKTFGELFLPPLGYNASTHSVFQSHVRLVADSFIVDTYHRVHEFDFSLWLAALGGLAGVMGTLFTVVFPERDTRPRQMVLASTPLCSSCQLPVGQGQDLPIDDSSVRLRKSSAQSHRPTSELNTALLDDAS